MRIFLTLLMLSAATFLNARQVVTFTQLRAMADGAPSQEVDMHINKTFAAPGTIRHSLEITEDLFIEGYVLTEPENPNKDLHYYIHYTTANSATNSQCAYLLGLDGKYGIRINATTSKRTW